MLAAVDDFYPPQKSFSETYGQRLVNSDLARNPVEGEENDNLLAELLEEASKIT
jgi:hypothetical protein